MEAMRARLFVLLLTWRRAPSGNSPPPPAPLARRFFVAPTSLSAERNLPMSQPDRVIIFDTTLRDGEQSPGISLDVAEKLEIAEQLARVGVDYIEAGFPVASQGDFDAVQAIARSVGNGADAAAICGLSRTQLSDVDRCWEAVREAARSRIHVFISTSPQHMEHMLKMSQAQVLTETR